MSHNDPIPEAQPAIPLAYQRNPDRANMVWVVRFTAWWILLSAGMAMVQLLSSYVSLWSRVGMPGFTDLTRVVPLITASVMGWGILHQKRWALSALLWMIPTWYVFNAYYNISARMDRAIFVLICISGVPGIVTSLLMLRSILQRADSAGVLEPPRTAAPSGNRFSDLQFLASRVGWILLIPGMQLLIQLALLPVISRFTPNIAALGWSSLVPITAILACSGVCLGLIRHKQWAARCLIFLLPAATLIQQAAFFIQYQPPVGFGWTSYVRQVGPALGFALVGELAHSLLLWILLKKWREESAA